MNPCHKCQYDGKGNEACLSCEGAEQYAYPYGRYLFDDVQIPQPSTQGSGRVLSGMTEDAEDRFRHGLIELFDLQPLEILMLQAIMHNKSLTDYARDIDRMVAKLANGMTRFHAYQIRKAILRKLPQMELALQTNGQRRRLAK